MGPSVASATALCGALLFASAQLVAAVSQTTKDALLPSYNYGASIPVECMNRSM